MLYACTIAMIVWLSLGILTKLFLISIAKDDYFPIEMSRGQVGFNMVFNALSLWYVIMILVNKF